MSPTNGKKIDGFSIFGRCSVVYNGRASSVLETGNYLVLCKPDLCIAVHGGSFIKPLNYQNPGSKIELLKEGQEFDDLCSNYFEDEKPQLVIYATNKKESLIVGVHEVISHKTYRGWDSNKIKLIRSERDLVNQIVARYDHYFPDIDAVQVETEVPTPYGNVDIVLIDRQGVRYLVEVKRTVMSVAGCGQVARYAAYYTSKGIRNKQYVAAPTITANAMTYVQEHGQTWVEAQFDVPQETGAGDGSDTDATAAPQEAV